MDPDPDTSFIQIGIILLILLLVLSAFFSMTETAFTSFNAIRIEKKANDGSKTAKLCLYLRNHYDRLISSILIGNNIVNIAAAAIATVMFTQAWGDMGATYSTIVVTIVVLIFGEVCPKSMAKERPEGFALFATYPIAFFYYLFFPISYLLGLLTKLIKLPFKKKGEQPTYTEEEFQMLVDDIHEEGVLNELEKDLIQNTIEYGDTKVEDTMIKINKVTFIHSKDSIEDITKTFLDTHYSRIPVAKGKSPDSIYGLLYSKDFFGMLTRKETSIKPYIKNISVTKPSIKISRLLKRFQASRQHMALVKDEKKVLGIITMEDILEELVGEIKDEYDD